MKSKPCIGHIPRNRPVNEGQLIWLKCILVMFFNKGTLDKLSKAYGVFPNYEDIIGPYVLTNDVHPDEKYVALDTLCTKTRS